MAVRRRGDRYIVEFEIKGHRVFRRLPHGATKAQASELDTRLRHQLIDVAIIGKRPNVTLEYAIKAWLEEVVKGRKSEKQTRSHAGAVLRKAALGAGVSDVFAAIAGAAESVRSESSLSPGTLNRRLCILKAVAKFAWRKDWLDENLSGKIQLLPEKKYQRREVAIEDAEKLILKASTSRAKALIALSAYTGLRLGEVLKLKPEDVKDDVIVVRDSKTGEDRVVPILKELRPHLKELPFQAGWRNVYRGFLRARERAGLTIRYHDLRHMVASALARSGADLRLSMDIMGHKSVETHRRYVHTDIDAKRKALVKALSHRAPIRRKVPRGTKAKKAA